MKKIISVFLVVVLMATLMSSCTINVSNNNGNTDSSEHHESSEATDSTTDTMDTAENTETSGNDTTGPSNDSEEFTTNTESEMQTESSNETVEIIPDEVEIDPEHVRLAESDCRYAWVVAFISKDSEKCEQILNDTDNAVDVGQMDRLKDLTFGGYSVEEEDTYSIKFDFEIVSSNYELYPVGKYSASISAGGFFNFSCFYSSRPSLCDESLIDKYEEEYKFISEFVASCAEMDFPNDYRSNIMGWAYLTEALFVYYGRANGYQYTSDVELTLDELRDVAKEVYAIDDFELYPDGCWKLPNGKYSRPGHGGMIVEAKITDITEENGVISIDIQYFGDWTTFSDAGVVRFTMERTSTEYSYKLLKIEKIKHSAYGICMQTV